MLTKEIIQKTLNTLPESFSMEELIDRIMLHHKIEVGMEQAKNGEVYTTEEAKDKLKKWFR